MDREIEQFLPPDPLKKCMLARISRQFRRCQLRSFGLQIIVNYFDSQNTEEDGTAWAALQEHLFQGSSGEHFVETLILVGSFKH
ncbi:hypothetical protein [Desulfosediminicola sp.]|uniref:hypothetical protein n=1 Tax=Desulfosediminicola sp. TaxID=2886825 RepID=UPI003AF27E23